MFRCSTPLLVFAVALAAAPLGGCSDAETPNAYFDAGTQIVDAGPYGRRDQPCLDGRCLQPLIDICVQQGGSAGSTFYCREICPLADEDPCGDGRTCRALDTGDGACLPANGLDGPCPCDDGLACVNYTVEIAGNLDGGVVDGGADGGTQTIQIRNRCKIECTIDPADQTDDCPEGQGRCRAFVNEETDGVCLIES